MVNKIKFFILTGDPGVGKTTLTKKIIHTFRDKNIPIHGFYTEEVRKGGYREGFDIVSLDGERGQLARDSSLLREPGRFRVGKYGVLVNEFEKIALPIMKKSEDPNIQILVLDEIGKMELLSHNFKLHINEIFKPKTKCLILATIPNKRSDPVIDSIRRSNLSKVWTVTKENRNMLLDEILNDITSVLN